MSQATLAKGKVRELLAFCKKHKLEEFFFAKDHGAYFGATKEIAPGKLARSVHYVRGCNPNTMEFDEWWHNQQSRFGGDDFGEHLPVSVLADCVEFGGSLTLKFSPTEIRAVFKR